MGAPERGEGEAGALWLGVLGQGEERWLGPQECELGGGRGAEMSLDLGHTEPVQSGQGVSVLHHSEGSLGKATWSGFHLASVGESGQEWGPGHLLLVANGKVLERPGPVEG